VTGLRVAVTGARAMRLGFAPRLAGLGRVGGVSARRGYVEYQPPNKPEGKSQTERNAHRAFYSSFGSPILKAFLGALFTYQLIYWGWMKLESLDIKHEKNAEISKLETELKTLTGKKKEEKA